MVSFFPLPRGKIIGEIRRVRRTGVFLESVSFALTSREGAARGTRPAHDLLHIIRQHLKGIIAITRYVVIIVMHFISNSLYKHAKLLAIIVLILITLVAGILLRNKIKRTAISVIQESDYIEYGLMTNATVPGKADRKEYLYRLLTNTTRSLIQMEIKARRLEENMRRIKEKTSDLLWKNKDSALWHILFKNISRHISIRHQFHQHSSLRRILKDTENTHKHKKNNHKV